MQVGAALALLGVLAGSASGSGTPAHGQIAGILPPTSHFSLGQYGNPSPFDSPGSDCSPLAQNPPCTKLQYHGGPVIHTITNYAIFWMPVGYTSWDGQAPYSAGYVSTIDQFFTDLQDASGTTANVYGVGTQYCNGATNNATSCSGVNAGNFITTNSTYGGHFMDTDPYPTSGNCSDPLGLSSVCLTDTQLTDELQTFMAAQHPALTASETHEFFIYTPRGVQTCYDDFGDCTYTAYCAYHSNIGTGNSALIYANMAYPLEGSVDGDEDVCRDTGNIQQPNNDIVDAVLSTTSHENNESITDPEPSSGWYNDDDETGGEDGDKCAYYYGSPVGGSAHTEWNQVINGDHYWLQLEWSNSDFNCVQTYTAPVVPVPTITSFSPTSGVSGAKVTIVGTNFTGVTHVKFNGVDASSFSVKGSKITTVVPATATTGTITVTNAGGPSTDGGTFTISLPVITKENPMDGVIGQPISVSGTNLVGVSGVTINGTPESFTATKKALMVTVGAGTTSGNLVVTTPGGTAGTSFTVDASPMPTIKSVSKKAHVGSTISVSGTGFYGASAVHVNGTACAISMISGSTKLSCVVGGGTTSGTVTVTTPGGTSAPSTGSVTIS